jgi:hypothetical protein
MDLDAVEVTPTFKHNRKLRFDKETGMVKLD